MEHDPSTSAHSVSDKIDPIGNEALLSDELNDESFEFTQGRLSAEVRLDQEMKAG